ncbi:Stk1 family PASTA domain-containing Ser/Thr kinase [Spirilliplanes yamanashiensis]|uniref:non-specific serine/threonine protein kinase n=1 Tax=Spirilliplanes yamanashiensis TaxID=42233 RepID=A0A8J3Y6Y3_9ACTN|nr:Stk1 family PASTA domain-containing Ser/Thr kinase [Spirilliplanes yamanashiensis]MDP9815019.1 serine/threonine-protein kinase [Spirilliplanes yamanashiensis]GIJ02675.1 putative serine/threonine-protein kinase PknB [Spirilliplanes yamanashiensis]
MTAQARLLGGRYQVGELLGYGGMAEVHRGRDLRLGRDVAVKMLRADLARDATFQERFRREAQNAAALNHPAIVAVYDTGEETGATGERLPFIVMEYVAGHTLKEVLAAEQRLQPRRALEIIADICAALEFSHRHGIIHRDIKPGNVMMTPNGQVKVMDFGIARALASGATTMTQTSAVIGTAQYLSPEQARGESVDARSDVYAAGCVLFELLCGHPPFVGDSPVSVAYQHVREDPKAPSDINPEVPPDVDAIVLKALAKNPLNRYQSAQEMRADALRAVSGRPVLATPVMTEAETMALGGPVRTTGMTRTVPAGGPVGGPPPRKTSNWVMAVLAALGVLAVVALGVGLVLANRGGEQQVQQVTVPDLTGQSEDQAKSELTNAKLVPAKGPDIKDEGCEKNQVADWSPKGGPVDQGSTVTYQMCVGPEQVPIPRLVGLSEDAARDNLENIGLKMNANPVDGAQPEGTVVKAPDEGKSVDRGTTVKVDVSKGNLTEVPDVTGQIADVGIQRLRELGFKVQPIADPTETVPAGQEPRILEQSVKGTAKKGATIQVRVETIEQEPDPGQTTPGPDGSTPPGDGGGGGLLEDGLFGRFSL